MNFDKKMVLAISSIGFIILCFNVFQVDAGCVGSIIFYWKEAPKDRLSKNKNWGVLEAKFKSNRNKLSKYMKTDYTYSFKIEGDCCWEVYRENDYEGESRKLVIKLKESGFGQIPGYNSGLRANSLKKMECEK